MWITVLGSVGRAQFMYYSIYKNQALLAEMDASLLDLNYYFHIKTEGGGRWGKIGYFAPEEGGLWYDLCKRNKVGGGAALWRKLEIKRVTPVIRSWRHRYCLNE